MSKKNRKKKNIVPVVEVERFPEITKDKVYQVRFRQSDFERYRLSAAREGRLLSQHIRYLLEEFAKGRLEEV